MKMDTNIRVRTDRRFRTLYKQLKGLVVGDMHELFFLCACLGYKRRNAVPVGKAADDRFWSGTIEPDEWSCYYAMVLEENAHDFTAIQDDKAVVERVEQYANGGLIILIDELLKEYLAADDGEPAVDPGSIGELPKELLQYIFAERLAEDDAPR